MSSTSPALSRLLEPSLVQRLEVAPVVVLTGPRQSGKTTLVRGFPGAAAREYRTLDSLAALDQARSDPEHASRAAGPLTIDEVQRVPELLVAVKAEVDRRDQPGRFLLTGSANLLLMRSVSESLAGRAAYLTLGPLTPRELRGDLAPTSWERLLAAEDPGQALASLTAPSPFDWHDAALRGGFPRAALAARIDDRVLWFENYVTTYVERDVRDLTQVGDLGAFVRLLKLASLRVGGLLNQSELGRDAGLSRATAQRWLSIFTTSFVTTLVEPFFASGSKRLIKSPKLYFVDTGLALHLAGVADASTMAALPRAGAWLENLVLADLLVWRETRVRKPGVFHHRTVSGDEVDFVVEDGRRLLPIEIKAGTAARPADARGIDALCRQFPERAPFGVLVYNGRDAFALTPTTLAVPLGSVM